MPEPDAPPDGTRVIEAVIVLVVVAGAAWLLAQALTPSRSGAPTDVYDPVRAGEEPPDGFRQLLPRDGIPPIYDPEFTTPGEVGWPAETLVIGVAEGGEAKAYPISPLNAREMVIDRLAGIPILVTW